MIKLSYAVTVCNELVEVAHLLRVLTDLRRPDDQIVVLYDNREPNTELKALLDHYAGNFKQFSYTEQEFEGDFAQWKNRLTDLCTGDYIFQIDADEYPASHLINTLPTIIEELEQKEIEVLMVPRINTVEGLTAQHLNRWGWNVNADGWVNFPDHQWRIYKRADHIKWINKVHERLEGFKAYGVLPDDPAYCLMHPKTIERQERQNQLYSIMIS